VVAFAGQIVVLFTGKYPKEMRHVFQIWLICKLQLT
jgi:hypothetical protein